jgi:UDPglucose 6-dehydrogenase
LNVVVVGAGYVGLVSAACLAQAGNRVICVDKDLARIAALRQGVVPIYEPGLESVISINQRNGRLSFTTNLDEAAIAAEVIFIAVGTPSCADGSADVGNVFKAAKAIGKHISQYCVVVNKSTAPVGTAEKIRDVISSEVNGRGLGVPFDVVSNPEFLKEGSAMDDFIRPDRIIVGTDSERAKQIMARIYSPFDDDGRRIIFMGARDAEMTKYAANAMLATKISFMNNVANLCERMNVDVENVRVGIGSDSRIGHSYIYPGAGYGGSCLPKDVEAMIRMADERHIDLRVLRAVEKTNALQKRRLFQKIVHRFSSNLTGYSFGLWGLAFKANTDDIRESSSIDLLHQLIGAGARVRAFDPVAMTTAQRKLPKHWWTNGTLVFAEHQYDALRDADAMALVTAWDGFINPDFAFMRNVMKRPIIFDGRNIYEPQKLRDWGFEYRGIGR